MSTEFKTFDDLDSLFTSLNNKLTDKRKQVSVQYGEALNNVYAIDLQRLADKAVIGFNKGRDKLLKLNDASLKTTLDNMSKPCLKFKKCRLSVEQAVPLLVTQGMFGSYDPLKHLSEFLYKPAYIIWYRRSS